jgi:hypothetical protein
MAVRFSCSGFRHSIPPRALSTPVACTPPFAVSNCSSLRLFGPPSRQSAFQIQTSSLHLHSDRHHPSRCCGPFFVWRPPPQPSFRHHLHHPAASRHDCCHRQPVPAGRPGLKTTLSMHETPASQRPVCTPDWPDASPCASQIPPLSQQFHNHHHHRPSASISAPQYVPETTGRPRPAPTFTGRLLPIV